ARDLDRPVKWVCERSEGFIADDHARDVLTEAELALDGDGRFLALRVRNTNNLGAYLTAGSGMVPTFMNLGGLAGVYKTPAIHVEVTCVYTNTQSTTPYRGAGRPEASYVLERMIDLAADEMEIDRIDLRRRNIIPPDAMPYQTGLSFKYDSGEFEKNLDLALEAADIRGFENRRAESATHGMLRGFSVIQMIEQASGPRPEYAELRFDASGTLTVFAGTKGQGQGHDTMYKIMISDILGMDSDDVRLEEGDTDKVSFGMGTVGSRSAVTGGGAVKYAADKIIEKGKKIAAHMLEAAEADIEFDRGRFQIAGTDKQVGIQDVAKAAFTPSAVPPGMEIGLYENATYTPEAASYPNGCHICEVDIDEDTGKVTIVKYIAVDDVGTVVNMLTLTGQVHGGIVQGAGQALMENIVYDPGNGQMLSGSFMDYSMPKADDFCSFEVTSNPVPAKTNPLGIKGAGEAGTTGALPAVMNAVNHALKGHGIRHLEMPLTAEKVWRAIHST
ncbi:MAG: molybdopterin-dependent oxidoreductase, partial [Rhodospirillales bacterium]|nr:molybdopterin-dependent oxidoreductase [Rhodospirillales bacterium]